MICGNRNNLALEVDSLESDSGDGFVFLYLRNKRFGFRRHSYNVKACVNNVVKYFKLPEFDSKNLASCPPEILFSAFDKCYSEEVDFSELDTDSINDLRRDEINTYYSCFFQDFINYDNLDACVFRYGTYVFDDSTVILIPRGEDIKLYIRNDVENIMEDALIQKEDFISLWRCILDKLHSSI